jgi:hypothetical protein
LFLFIVQKKKNQKKYQNRVRLVFKLHRKQTNIKHLTKTVPDREEKKTAAAMD